LFVRLRALTKLAEVRNLVRWLPWHSIAMPEHENKIVSPTEDTTTTTTTTTT
jgi:hypothetical protein